MAKGYIHSIQSLATVDGPGVRFAAFLSGCPLRCSCCHNPDTWEFGQGQVIESEELVERAERFREYFSDRGGITLSGGEPLCQAEFVGEVFALCREKGINTCLDTSGVILDEQVKKALSFCDRVLLDIKYTDSEKYIKYTGGRFESVLEFLSYLEQKNIPTTVRQVVIPTINDDEENFERLSKIVRGCRVVDRVELLAFRKICSVKYDAMKLEFPFAHIPEADPEKLSEIEKEINRKIF